MEDVNFSPGGIFGSAFATDMDFDFMDELFDGCWLETGEPAEFLQQNPSLCSSHPSTQFSWPSHTYQGEFPQFQIPKSNLEENCKVSFPYERTTDQLERNGIVSTNPQSTEQEVSIIPGSSSQIGDLMNASGEAYNRKWWISPSEASTPALSVMERLIRAIACIKESKEDRDVLIQLWVPIYRGGRRVLTTDNQPYVLNSKSTSLTNYRNISVKYQFSADRDSKGTEGIPTRVFLGKVPEWTPDVRLYKSEEYARVDYAQRFNVRGTLVLPIFDQGSRTCLGVIEVVTTKQTIKYQHELESVCSALEAFDLSSVKVQSPPLNTCSQSYQTVLPEIREVLKSACDAHCLPLALTWIPCIQQGKAGCRHSDDNYIHCVSTVDSACYVADINTQGFFEACSEHHLLKGQGVAGKAFTTNQPCFCSDITLFTKTEYPLAHHVRMVGLHAAVAIRLRSIQSDATDFVLQFFLPKNCTDGQDQMKMLNSLSMIIQQFSRSLRVLTDEEVKEENASTIRDLTTANHAKLELANKVPLIIEKQEPRELVRETMQQQYVKPSTIPDKYKISDRILPGVSKKGDRRRTKAEKSISLQVLQQHFSGSLKDAAKSLGVCPTTLKRICRQHGIERWPSRKIKKVGHSLEKLQRVIDSVQETSGSFKIGSVYSNFPELGNEPGGNPLLDSKSSNMVKSPSQRPECDVDSPFTALKSKPKSLSTSYSQSSSSSHSSSSATPQCRAGSSKDTLRTETSESKKARLEAVMPVASQQPTPLPKSQSFKSFEVNTKQAFPHVPKHDFLMHQEADGRRVKVTYGEENIRFRMQSSWGFKDLIREISYRFNVEDMSDMQLKYLDDDLEMVLLTCDADWEECLDICQLSEGQTIKLHLLAPATHHIGSSFGSTGIL
ncbi:unnamed protein product [Rhodiola kirilowii]